jgi:site-specific recombinase XerD
MSVSAPSARCFVTAEAPKISPEFARTYLNDGTHDLAEASILRHRLNIFKQQRDKTGDMKTYLEKKGHLVEFFGNRDFKGIGVRDVLAYIRKRQIAGAAANTILKELATLSTMFQFALSQELVLSNPVLSVKKPKLTLRRPHYTPTRQELLRIFQHL